MKRNTNVTIIMYHYVRDLAHSQYPDIKGLDIILFREQIKHLKRNHNLITMEMLIDALDNETTLPKDAVLLTFDDAYSEHYTYIFPLLDENKIQGSFYTPVKAVTQHTVLDVNKIHFILAVEKDKSKILREINTELNNLKNDYNLENYDYYFSKLAHPNRFDTAEVIFIKRLLQVELDEQVRNIITNNLFEKVVGRDQASFSRELYMDIEQIKCMRRNGMHIGSHGYDHYWLGSLSEEDQKQEIKQSLNFLGEIGCDINQWTISYPYGNYSDTTIKLLQQYNCKLAFTTEVQVADVKRDNRFTLPRLDTNDIIIS